MNHVTAKIGAIILAGGSGTRMGGDLPKQFLELDGEPIIVKTLRQFAMIPAVKGIVIACPAEHIAHTESLVTAHDVQKIVAIVPGGETRQGSSHRALLAIPRDDDEIVIIHDAVRPFVRVKTILACLEAAAKTGAAGVYVRAIDTIAEIEGDRVRAALPRGRLHYTQTPQAFRYSIIRQAHEQALAAGITDATDDVGLVVAIGLPVAPVEGDYKNIKITTPFDYVLAKTLVESG